MSEESLEETSGSEERGEASGGAELDRALTDVRRSESKRRRWAAILGIVGFTALIGGMFGVFYCQRVYFPPRVEIETNDRSVLQKTDDPECRRLISEMGEVRRAFFDFETRVERVIPGGSAGEVRSILDRIGEFERRLDRASTIGERANLRFERSREELERWFAYADREFGILERVCQRAVVARDAGAAQAVAVDAGDSAGDVGARRAAIAAQRDETLAALHDAFERFRVWHTAAKHPCGRAGDDEAPWRPADARSERGADGRRRGRDVTAGSADHPH